MGYKEEVRAMMVRHLPDFREVEGPIAGGAVIFSSADRSRFLSFEPAGANHLWLTFSDEQGTLAEEDGWQGGRRRFIGPFLKKADLVFLERWVAHYRQAWNLLDLNDHFLERFRDARQLPPEELKLLKAAVQDQFSKQMCHAADFTSPLGSFLVKPQKEQFGEFGRIPPFLKLSFDPTPTEWSHGLHCQSYTPDLGKAFYLSLDFHISLAQERDAVDTFFDDVRARLDNGETISFSAHGFSVAIRTVGDEIVPEVNLALVKKFNGGHADYARLLERLGDDWRLAYDRIETASDPLALLTQATRDRPREMRTWRELASYHSAQGNPADANVALAAGYAAKGSMGIARGKLKLALDHDPGHKGALELFLNLFNRG